MKVQDNFLRNDLFKFILNTINDTNFCWQCNKIVSEEKFQSDLKYNKQFVHKWKNMRSYQLSKKQTRAIFIFLFTFFVRNIETAS